VLVKLEVVPETGNEDAVKPPMVLLRVGDGLLGISDGQDNLRNNGTLRNVG